MSLKVNKTLGENKCILPTCVFQFLMSWAGLECWLLLLSKRTLGGCSNFCLESKSSAGSKSSSSDVKL